MIIVKRAMDLTLSILAVVILLPIIVMLCLLVRFKLGSPIFFKQERVGKKGKIFKMYKFRTMTDERDKNGELLPDNERLTVLGRILRSTSLDELPELINIIKGDMSIVGPRPLLVEYIPLYSKEQFRRHEVLPGLTGFAQINGRNSISWKEKFYLDLWYVDNWSLLLDLKIIALTFIKVFKREGINQGVTVTMEKFNGFN